MCSACDSPTPQRHGSARRTRHSSRQTHLAAEDRRQGSPPPSRTPAVAVNHTARVTSVCTTSPFYSPTSTPGGSIFMGRGSKVRFVGGDAHRRVLQNDGCRDEHSAHGRSPRHRVCDQPLWSWSPPSCVGWTMRHARRVRTAVSFVLTRFRPLQPPAASWLKGGIDRVHPGEGESLCGCEEGSGQGRSRYPQGRSEDPHPVPASHPLCNPPVPHPSRNTVSNNPPPSQRVVRAASVVRRQTPRRGYNRRGRPADAPPNTPSGRSIICRVGSER